MGRSTKPELKVVEKTVKIADEQSLDEQKYLEPELYKALQQVKEEERLERVLAGSTLSRRKSSVGSNNKEKTSSSFYKTLGSSSRSFRRTQTMN
jgi:transposase